MRTVPLILTFLLGLQLAAPLQLCLGEDNCHLEEVETAVEESTHACCANGHDQAPEEQDCQDDCSCSCCRALVNVAQVYESLPETLPVPSRLPLFRASLPRASFGPAIWEPPQLA